MNNSYLAELKAIRLRLAYMAIKAIEADTLSGARQLLEAIAALDNVEHRVPITWETLDWDGLS